MVRTGSIIALLVGLMTQAATQAGWAVLREVDFHVDFYDVSWSPDGATALAYGYDGGLVRTTDAGVQWQQIDPGTEYDLNGLAWQDTSNVWICGSDSVGWGSSGVLLTSSDGGATWRTVINDHPTVFDDVFFLDYNNGWLSAPGAELLRTTDGGGVWNPIPLVDVEVGTMEFVDPSIGFSAGGLFAFDLNKTTDGGLTWTELHTTNASITGIDFPTGTTGYISWLQGVDKSTDGGLSWSNKLDVPMELLTSIDFLDVDHGWAVGRLGGGGEQSAVVRRTTDAGATWEL
ncbi:hypothetical protein JW905_13835, partial [bacterium]|nr:hypothetical protein [candidate division CSSED10-310 bacterium]